MLTTKLNLDRGSQLSIDIDFYTSVTQDIIVAERVNFLRYRISVSLHLLTLGKGIARNNFHQKRGREFRLTLLHLLETETTTRHALLLKIPNHGQL